jgi:hypothetical protein
MKDTLTWFFTKFYLERINQTKFWNLQYWWSQPIIFDICYFFNLCTLSFHVLPLRVCFSLLSTKPTKVNLTLSLSFYFFILFCCLPYQNTCRLHALTTFGSQAPLSRNCVHTVHHPPCIGKFWNHLVVFYEFMWPMYYFKLQYSKTPLAIFILKKCWDRKEEAFSLVLFLKKLDCLNLDKDSKRQPPSNEKGRQNMKPFSAVNLTTIESL